MRSILRTQGKSIINTLLEMVEQTQRTIKYQNIKIQLCNNNNNNNNNNNHSNNYIIVLYNNNNNNNNSNNNNNNNNNQ